MTERQKRKMNYGFNRFLKWGYSLLIGVVLIIGLLLVFHQPIIDKVWAPHKLDKQYELVEKMKSVDYQRNQQVLDKYQYQLENNLLNQEQKDPNITYDFGNVKPIRLMDIKDVSLDTRYVRGQISIPSVNMRLPILEGVSNNNLWLGAGTLKPNQQMGKGNYSLAGHTMPNPGLLFTPLHQVSKGSSIYITDGQYVYTYKTTKTEIVSPQSGNIIQDEMGDKMITLVTCSDLKATNRLIVQGKLIGKEKLSASNQSFFDMTL